MKFETHVADWEQLAKDPLWAVLTRRRDWSVEEFFATGEGEASALFAIADRLDRPVQRTRAMDFGCGVGRLTRQLAKRFPECWGIDISRQMLDLAAKYSPECHFHLSRNRDLRDFPNNHFDLIYSALVLQHQPDANTILNYICEFVRVLNPGGLLAFQLPSSMPLRYWLAPRRRAYRLLHAAGVDQERLRRWNLFPMRMTAVAPARVRQIIQEAGGKVLLDEPHSGSAPIPSRIYYCTK